VNVRIAKRLAIAIGTVASLLLAGGATFKIG